MSDDSRPVVEVPLCGIELDTALVAEDEWPAPDELVEIRFTRAGKTIVVLGYVGPVEGVVVTEWKP